MSDDGRVDSKGRQDRVGLVWGGCLHVLVVIYQEALATPSIPLIG